MLNLLCDILSEVEELKLNYVYIWLGLFTLDTSYYEDPARPKDSWTNVETGFNMTLAYNQRPIGLWLQFLSKAWGGGEGGGVEVI